MSEVAGEFQLTPFEAYIAYLESAASAEDFRTVYGLIMSSVIVEHADQRVVDYRTDPQKVRMAAAVERSFPQREQYLDKPVAAVAEVSAAQLYRLGQTTGLPIFSMSVAEYIAYCQSIANRDEREAPLTADHYGAVSLLQGIAGAEVSSAINRTIIGSHRLALCYGRPLEDPTQYPNGYSKAELNLAVEAVSVMGDSTLVQDAEYILETLQGALDRNEFSYGSDDLLWDMVHALHKMLTNAVDWPDTTQDNFWANQEPRGLNNRAMIASIVEKLPEISDAIEAYIAAAYPGRRHPTDPTLTTRTMSDLIYYKFQESVLQLGYNLADRL